MARKSGNRPTPDKVQPNPSPAGMIQQLYKPNARECALLILHLWRSKEQEMGKEVTRLNISEASLRHLCCRNRLTPDLLEEVNEWLADAGVALFFAETTYGVIKTSVVESWTRTTSKRLSADLERVAADTFDFSTLNHLLARPSEEGNEAE